MELEAMNLATLVAEQKDLETIEDWATRNGLTEDTARKWVNRSILPSIKIGKRRLINCVLLRSWLLEQEWTA